MAPDPTYRRADGWVSRSFGGSVLLMSRPPDAIRLDGAAAIVWSELTNPASAPELIGRSWAAWASAPGEPAELVGAAIRELVGLGAIERCADQDVRQ